MASCSTGSSNPCALEKVDYHAAEALESWGSASEPSSRSLDHLQQLWKAAATVPEDVLKSRCPRLKLLAVTTKLLEQLDGLGSVTTHSSAPHAILVAHARSTAAAIANALRMPWCQPGVAPRKEVLDAIRARDWFNALQALSLHMIVDMQRAAQEAESNAAVVAEPASLLKRRKVQVGVEAACADLIGVVKIINEKGLPQPDASQGTRGNEGEVGELFTPGAKAAAREANRQIELYTPGAKAAAGEVSRCNGEAVEASSLRLPTALASQSARTPSLLFDAPIDHLRKSGKRWTLEEEQRLIKAWKQHGKQGQWEDIRRRSGLMYFSDKLRNLQKAGHPDVIMPR